MKHWISITILVTSTLISGCGIFSKAKPNGLSSDKSINTQMTAQNRDADETIILQKLEFVQGVSSVTVERLAAKNQCSSKLGAGQITPKGPTEIYRVSCDDGRVFMAKCELRQCQPMLSK